MFDGKTILHNMTMNNPV